MVKDVVGEMESNRKNEGEIKPGKNWFCQSSFSETYRLHAHYLRQVWRDSQRWATKPIKHKQKCHSY